MPLWVAPKGARSLRPLPEGRVSTRVVMCDSTVKAITYPQPRCFCYSYCEKILPAALRAKNTAKWDRLDKIPNLNRIPSPGPGHQPTSLLPQISGQVRGRGPGPARWLCGQGGGTHHVMLEDSLDHRREDFNDHHGPRPLSAVLKRQEDTVSPRPSGPADALTVSVCGSRLGSGRSARPQRLGSPAEPAIEPRFTFGSKQSGWDATFCWPFVLVLKPEVVSDVTDRSPSRHNPS